jgi:hypothetical protein
VSTALAIAAVTKVLTTILDRTVNASGLSGVLEAPVTSALPPDRIPSGDSEKPHLNLFLHRVSFNAGWRDANLPSRDSAGSRVSRPPLALDLHYILSAYSDLEYQGEMLLGLGMQALHENPVLTRDEIRAVFNPPPPGVTPTEKIVIALATSELADQAEMIRIVPETLPTEEISRLWTAFQAKYRPSAAYHASVVLIETKGSFKSALPVLQRNVFAFAASQPVIEQVEEQMLPFSAGAVLHLRGQALNSVDAVVRFGTGEEAAPDRLLSTAGRLSVPLPALRAGLNAVQVIRKLQLGSGATRPVVESNVAAFVLQPVVTKTLGVDDIAVTPGAPPAVSVKIDPPVVQGQKVSFLLDQTGAAVGAVPNGYVFDLPPVTGAATNTVGTPLPGIASGSYLLRVRVDGAQSPFAFDASGAFSGPVVVIP